MNESRRLRMLRLLDDGAREKDVSWLNAREREDPSTIVSKIYSNAFL